LANYFAPNRRIAVESLSELVRCRLNLVYLHRSVGSRIDPEIRVDPLVGKFDLDQMIAFCTPRSVTFKDCCRAFASAVNSSEHQSSALVVGLARWTTRLADKPSTPSASGLALLGLMSKRDE
jgi:hypothetical protein